MADASIFSMIRPTAPPPDPVQQYGQALNLKALMGQQELQGLQTQQARKAVADDEATSAAYREAGGDPVKVRDILYGRGLYKPALAAEKVATETAKAQADLQKTKIETHLKATEGMRDVVASLSPQNYDPNAIREQATRLFGPDVAAKMNIPAQFDPAWQQQQVLTAKELISSLEKAKDRNLKAVNEPFTVGPNGQPVANQPVQSFQLQKAATGAPKVTVPVNVSTEKKYGEQFAGNIAKADSEMRDIALKAPDLAQRANDIKQTLNSGKIVTGSGADVRLAIGKALGLAGASDAETIANTELLSTQLARNTLDAIKASGLGAGNGFSNADRDFLEKAVGGKITLEKETIDRLATIQHNVASAAAKKWSTRVKEIPASALEGTGIQTEPVQIPPLYSPGGAAAPGAQPGVKIPRYNPQTGKIER